MKKVWNLLPQGLRERPFDLYTAFALIAVGIYGFIDPHFPEKSNEVIGALLFHIIELYFIIASIVLVAAILCTSKKHPIFSFLGQMYSWAFIAAAGIAVMTFQLWTGITNNISIETNSLYWLIFFVFGCIGWAAFFRSTDMFFTLKKIDKDKI
jgi:hypothetical protein